jgi:hypothetical protein
VTKCLPLGAIQFDPGFISDKIFEVGGGMCAVCFYLDSRMRLNLFFDL